MKRPTRRAAAAVSLAALALPATAAAQTVTVDASKRHQTMDGFGTCLSGSEAMQSWWQQLYFDDLAASMVRVDITPTFTAQYKALSYCSPWFGQPAPLTLDSGGNGPDGTRTRQYTGAADYGAAFGGCSAPIAVMGTDIDKNAAYFDFTTAQAVPGLVAKLGAMKAGALGGFELYASMWSPAPWVKVSSGQTYSGGASPLPTAGVKWPFIWGGNFAGGKIDVSGTPLSQFDDGTGPTSALTQFTRGLAAFLHGFQSAFGVKFHAISIQNELTFEEFYNSGVYLLAADYVTAMKAARAELDAHADLASIAIIGPEDLMGGDAYGMWQYGSGSSEVDKNLHFLSAIAADPAATKAIGGFAIHGYGADGTSSAGASSQLWSWWANGWTTSPGSGIPANVQGFTSFKKTSWMTETSGEKPEWLASSTTGGFPDSGAFSIAVKIQQALTTGQQSAWLYWQLTDGNPSDDSHVQSLTDATQLSNDPKYVAAKHFFKYVRPGSVRADAVVTGAPTGDSGASTLLASAFVLDAAGTLTVVLVNEDAADASVTVDLASAPQGIATLQTYASSNGSYWKAGSAAVTGAKAKVTVPGYGVVTLTGQGTAMPGSDGGAGSDGGSSSGGADGGPGSGDAGGAAGPDATAGGDGGGEADSGGSKSSSGCGCLVAGQSGSGALAFALGLGAAAIGRRRRRG